MAEIGEHQFTRTKKFDSDARLDRVMDAKTRTIGVDKGALSGQVAEKNMMLSKESNRDLAYDQLAHYFDNKMLHLEQEKRDLKRGINKDHVDYWMEQQTKPTRREWDLSDPDMLKKDLPGRVGDYDHRLGISAAQTFVGEDLQAGGRKKLQCAQQRSWCEQQVFERQARDAAETEDKLNHEALMKAQLDHLENVATLEAGSRRALARQIAIDNLNTANMKGQKAYFDKESEQGANHAEQFNTFNSAFMTEHPSTAQSTLSGSRKRMDHYKGMSGVEKDNVLEFQAMQRNELAAKREAEKNEEIAYVQYSENVRRQLCATHSKVEDFKSAQRMAVAQQLQQMKAEKEMRDTHLNKTVYTNDPSEDYFGQFGRSHR